MNRELITAAQDLLKNADSATEIQLKDQLIPFGDRYLVRKKAQDFKTKGGIYLQNPEQPKVYFGEVMATGFGRRNTDARTTPLLVEVGATVCWSQYGGIEIEKDLVILKEDEIQAYIPKGTGNGDSQDQVSA